jgi:hypothetical protein
MKDLTILFKNNWTIKPSLKKEEGSLVLDTHSGIIKRASRQVFGNKLFDTNSYDDFLKFYDLYKLSENPIEKDVFYNSRDGIIQIKTEYLVIFYPEFCKSILATSNDLLISQIRYENSFNLNSIPLLEKISDTEIDNFIKFYNGL